MILSITTRYTAANSEDFVVLERLLAALGVERGPASESQAGRHQSKSADFFLPRSSFRLGIRASEKSSGVLPDLWINVSEPQLAFQVAKKLGCEIIQSSSGDDSSSDETASECFHVKLPSGAIIQIAAPRADPDEAQLPGLAGSLNAKGKRFGIVVSRFNSFITERLLQGAFDGLLRSGALRKDIAIIRVPGSFELPSAARTLAASKKYDAILCIGCLLRGDTAHYDVIVNEVTRGIGQSAQETGVPHAFGVLTCDTLEQAIDRAGLKMGNKGLEAAQAAVEMANLRQTLGERGVQKAPSKKRTQKKSTKGSAAASLRKKS
jgi:6,7-dimethyl-8-ribityllumazine synthase